MATNSATYLLEGLFPTLFRYLSERSRYTPDTTKNLTRTTSAIVSTVAQDAVIADNGVVEEQRLPTDGITKVTTARDAPAKQLVAPRFIFPHPLVTFAEVPVVCRTRSNCVAARDVVDSERSLFSSEDASPSHKSSKVDAEPSSIKRNFGTPAQATIMSRQSHNVEAESSSAEESFDASAQSSRPELSAAFPFDSRKRLNRRSLPTTVLDHSRNISTSSNETLVWCPNDQSFTSSPINSLFDERLQDTAEKIIGQKQADKLHELEEVIEELRLRLAGQTERAEELESDLELCERHRELNFKTARRLYQDPGNSILVERRNMIDQIDHLKLEVWYRDSQIYSRDQSIETLRLDVALYANQEQWILLRQCYYALQQQYGQIPQDFRQLEQKYQDLENEYIDVSNRFKKLEGDHTEMKAQFEQIERERDRLRERLRSLASMQRKSRFQKPGTSGDIDIEEERGESSVPRAQCGDTSSSMSTSESHCYERSKSIAGAKNGSIIATTDRGDVLGSPDSFEARRRREVAAAEEEILGPLGLGFEAGSPTLKTKSVPEGAKSSEVSKVMDYSLTSPNTPDKTLEDLLTSAADGIDQVTPARTGGTSGITRDEWKVAGDDLHEFTEVFRGGRAQPIDIVSPGIEEQGAEDGCPRKVEHASQSSEERGNEGKRHGSAVVLNQYSFPQGHDGGFDGRNEPHKQIVTSSSTPTDGKRSDIWKGASFGIGKQEQRLSDYETPLPASPTATLKLESGEGFATFTSVSKTPLVESSPVIQDLGAGNEATKEVWDASPTFPKEALNASMFQGFEFGSGSGGIPFTGSESKTLALPEEASGPTLTGKPNFSSTSLGQAPGVLCKPSQFKQDFNFGGSTGRGVCFTATQNTSSTLPAPALEPESASETSALGTSPARTISSVAAQADEKAPQEEISTTDAISKEDAEAATLNPKSPRKKESKGKNVAQEAPKRQESSTDGLNRKQRRAAGREWKAAAKKAQAVADVASRRGRKAAARKPKVAAGNAARGGGEH